MNNQCHCGCDCPTYCSVHDEQPEQDMSHDNAYPDDTLKKQEKHIISEQVQTWEEKSKPTEAQLKYWERMRQRRGSDTPRWKGKKASKSAIHKWLYNNYGRPLICENPHCLGRSKTFDWAKKTDMEYEQKRENFYRFCRSCHRVYDLTPEKREKAIENLWWKKGVPNPTIKNKEKLTEK